MQLLISLSHFDYVLDNQYGRLRAQWKTDLQDEEDEHYLPEGYSFDKVLELDVIRATQIGKGYGDKLMKEFLSSSIAKKAELIFLDPVPNVFDRSSIAENTQIEKLKAFYAKFGFKNNPHSNRMWLVRKGKIADKDLPS